MVYATNPQTQLSNITAATEAQGVQVRISNLNDSKITMGANEATQQAAGFDPEVQTGGTSRTVTMRYLASYVKKNGDVEASAITTYVGFSVVYP
ncbi:serotype 2 fimbrial subunit [Bordetella pertussis]|nr:serotype 2 fimbrial subunit [Bordetella pertussis]